MSDTQTQDRPKFLVSPEFAGAIADLTGPGMRPALARLPIDTADMTFTLLRIAAKTDGDREATAFQSGVPKLRAEVEATREGFTTAPMKVSLPEHFCRRFLTTDRHQFAQSAMAVELPGLGVAYWENAGRSGVAFSCDDMTPAPEVSRGRKPRPVAVEPVAS
jgi:hypothetical protein